MGINSEILRKAREVGGIGGGQERAKNISPLMDDVAGRAYEWTVDQCTRFFEALLKKYVESKYLEQLLAESGFGAEYENIRSINKRHELLAEKYPAKYSLDKTTLRKRGKSQIDRVAEILEQDQKNGYAQAKQLLASILTDTEQEQLRLSGIVLPKASGNNSVKLKRTERIFGIGEADGQFVGREDLLRDLESGFREGYHIQFIGGSNGWGKSRVALEYAQRHAKEYQIICWINAWDENCIISSIANFFNLAKVPYSDALPGEIGKLFCRFFEANWNWLIVFDNADLKLSNQQAMLKKYMPSNEGHIIVTGNFGETAGMGHYKYYLLDRLNAEPSDSPMSPQLSKLCYGQPLPMTLISSYIRESSWVDAGTYLHMLEERGVGKENGPVSHIDEAAFEIKMWALQNQRRYFGDKVAVAVRQFLLINAICNPVDLDLSFLSVAFPIFPEPLGEVCSDKNLREQLIEKLRGFGFYEIRDGVLHSNSWLNELSRDYFCVAEISDMCAFLLDRMEKSIIVISNNQYLGNADALIALAKPYIDQTLRYMHWFGNLTDDQVAQRYPNARALIYSSTPGN